MTNNEILQAALLNYKLIPAIHEASINICNCFKKPLDPEDAEWLNIKEVLKNFAYQSMELAVTSNTPIENLKSYIEKEP